MTIQLFVSIVFTDALKSEVADRYRVFSISDTQWGSLHLETCIVDQPCKVKRTEIISHYYCFEDNLEQYGVK
ncbi:hypothetical protein LENED_012851 [Lentinula edodes]|uniref:Uncharacterized protein n=1 Tax=Lentinula edodes TaxID=5353 RepID=A0A1Q3ETR1_LENED|nr:hypothetical protein LENED_012851 [Lentinula edodes]